MIESQNGLTEIHQPKFWGENILCDTDKNIKIFLHHYLRAKGFETFGAHSMGFHGVIYDLLGKKDNTYYFFEVKTQSDQIKKATKQCLDYLSHSRGFQEVKRCAIVVTTRNLTSRSKFYQDLKKHGIGIWTLNVKTHLITKKEEPHIIDRKRPSIFQRLNMQYEMPQIFGEFWKQIEYRKQFLDDVFPERGRNQK
jgi:Holliday junction resolvase